MPGTKIKNLIVNIKPGMNNHVYELEIGDEGYDMNVDTNNSPYMRIHAQKLYIDTYPGRNERMCTIQTSEGIELDGSLGGARTATFRNIPLKNVQIDSQIPKELVFCKDSYGETIVPYHDKWAAKTYLDAVKFALDSEEEVYPTYRIINRYRGQYTLNINFIYPMGVSQKEFDRLADHPVFGEIVTNDEKHANDRSKFVPGQKGLYVGVRSPEENVE